MGNDFIILVDCEGFWGDGTTDLFLTASMEGSFKWNFGQFINSIKPDPQYCLYTLGVL